MPEEDLARKTKMRRIRNERMEECTLIGYFPTNSLNGNWGGNVSKMNTPNNKKHYSQGSTVLSSSLGANPSIRAVSPLEGGDRELKNAT